MMPKKISGISMVRKSAISGMFSLLMVKASPAENFRGEMRTLGSGVGTIDIYTVRDYGHLNSEHHGTLTGIEKYSQEEFDEHTQAGMSGNQPIGNASHN